MSSAAVWAGAGGASEEETEEEEEGITRTSGRMASKGVDNGSTTLLLTRGGCPDHYHALVIPNCIHGVLHCDAGPPAFDSSGSLAAGLGAPLLSPLLPIGGAGGGRAVRRRLWWSACFCWLLVPL